MNNFLSIKQQSDMGMGGSMMNFDFSFEIIIFVMLFMVFFSCVIAFLVYRDASNKGNSSASMWFIIVFFTSFFGVIIYLIYSDSQIKTSPNYDNPDQTSEASPKYNQMIENICDNCGSELEPGNRFCKNCGTEKIIQ